MWTVVLITLSVIVVFSFYFPYKRFVPMILSASVYNSSTPCKKYIYKIFIIINYKNCKSLLNNIVLPTSGYCYSHDHVKYHNRKTQTISSILVSLHPWYVYHLRTNLEMISLKTNIFIWVAYLDVLSLPI